MTTLRSCTHLPEARRDSPSSLLVLDDVSAASARSRAETRTALTRLLGLRVLIAGASEPLAAMLESILFDAGCAVIGPIVDIPEALRVAGGAQVDAGVLSVAPHDGSILHVAAALAERRVPHVFVSGCAKHNEPSDRAMRPLVPSPIVPEELLRTLTWALRR